MITKVNVAHRAEVDAWILATVQEDSRVLSASIMGCEQLNWKTRSGTRSWLSADRNNVQYCLRTELKAVENHGSIVNISSIQGVMGRSKRH